MNPWEDTDTDPFDEELADRFRLLERVEPPNTLDLALARSTVTSLPLDRSDRRRNSRVFWGAVAAAGLVAATGLSLATLTGGDDGGPVKTSDAAESSPADDGDGPNAVLEVPASGGDPVDVSGGQTDGMTPAGQDGNATASSAGGDGSGEGSDGSTAGSPDQPPTSSGTATTPTTEPPGPSSTANTVPAGDPTTSSTWYSLVPNDTKPRTISGTLTAVFTDCLRHQYLHEDGSVVDGAVSCDGGSWIEIDGQRIRTSGGMAADGQSFNRHPIDATPGLSATATVVSDVHGLTLECVVCRVQIGG